MPMTASATSDPDWPRWAAASKDEKTSNFAQKPMSGGMPLKLNKQIESPKAVRGWVQPRPDRSSTDSTTRPFK